MGASEPGALVESLVERLGRAYQARLREPSHRPATSRPFGLPSVTLVRSAHDF